MLTPTPVENQVNILRDHAKDLAALNDSAAIGDALLKLEAELGSNFLEFLKENFVPEIARYFRNLAVQTNLAKKVPELRDRILSLPLSHAAALMAATEEQIREILMSEAKWTIAMLKEKLSNKIVLGKVATDRDWEIVQKRLGLGPLEIPLYKAQAQTEANGGDVTTDLIVKVLEDANYNVSKLIKRAKKPKVKSPVPENLGRLLLDRDSLQKELSDCVQEGPAKDILRQELNKTTREIAELTGVPHDPIIEELKQENQQLRQQLAMATATTAATATQESQEVVTPQKVAKKPAEKLRVSFKKLTNEFVKFLPIVISAQTASEQKKRIEEFLLNFQHSYA